MALDVFDLFLTGYGGSGASCRYRALHYLPWIEKSDSHCHLLHRSYSGRGHTDFPDCRAACPLNAGVGGTTEILDGEAAGIALDDFSPDSGVARYADIYVRLGARC